VLRGQVARSACMTHASSLLNGAPVGIPYGAPLRVRVERQLGYKMAKSDEIAPAFEAVKGRTDALYVVVDPLSLLRRVGNFALSH
jgi:hypothetical protein